MEKQNPSSVPSIFRHNNSGVIKLPPGFRFQPTDEELVLQYLRRKVFSYPLHASFIPEVDLSKQNPWDLPVCGREQERYFFALRETKYANGTRTNRATEGGYWKATGKDRVVLATKCGRSIALKKTLVFHKGKAPRGQKTDWIMHEYSLAISNILSQRKNLTINGAVGMKDWVLCRIFKKKRSTKLVNHFTGSNSRESDERHPSSPAHSDSSCVTNHAIEESANKVDITSSLH